MESNTFYDIKNVTVAERESFNNTILLLTMVKSKYYYIIGFSRPKQIIKIGLDYESKCHQHVSETLNIDFGSSVENVKMHAVIQNACIDEFYWNEELSLKIGRVYKKGKEIVYECNIPKDKVIPMGIEEMNRYILVVKEEIGFFLERSYMRSMRQ